ncbi:GTPase HflX [Peloplasma aerotolerans]|uniref:GTPase HflX n=1 Tax=Peloplasma aerotolerans TaxID=3044389 RepID=A0AAW6U6J7_9MOLU|nr:GTPase HflX [Mariniplasma sp. M4Ah]MDI6452157.1 GTPase HflX [Mariniplasma sp. M4Ah]
MDQALLVGLSYKETTEQTLNSLNELEHLALALDIQTKDKVIQNAKTISSRFYIGSGKVQEIKKMIEVLDIDIVIFDDTLSPAQLKNLEKELEIQIIDRSFLILSIFAERAQSKEAVLEVSLAQKMYMLPRLVGLNNSLSRQGGGSYNAKGPGETKLELDRRKLLNDISLIKAELAKIKAEKQISRKQRIKNRIPVVALVGYTNAGKSSIMNSLSDYLHHDSEHVLEKNMLFATLDTKAKRLQKDNNQPFILVDTVGFVSKLPHELIRSFESTLSDVVSADLLLHIVDGAYFNQLQIDTTKQVLTEIGADHIERLLVLTKKEIALSTPQIQEDYIFVSNRTKENIDALVDAIYGHIYKSNRIQYLRIPFDKGQIYSQIKENNTVLETKYEEDGTYVKAILTPEQTDLLKQYIISKD